MKIVRYLIVSSSGDCRITQRAPRLGLDEVAVRVNINIPPGWGSLLAGQVEVNMPEPPQVNDVEVGP